MSRTTWPHHGPVTLDCPAECLLTALSRRSWNRVTRSPEDPATVRDVVAMAVAGKLPGVEGLGPKHVGEVKAALACLGFDITGVRPAQAGTA
jgi:hypothetical protein